MGHHVPKRLWMYWHQGWENAPERVRRCAATWKRHNAGWDVHLLDKTYLSGEAELRSVLKTTLPTKQNISEIVRLDLLRQWGGVWADATCWCMRPLDDWVGLVSSRSGFFEADFRSPHQHLVSCGERGFPNHRAVLAGGAAPVRKNTGVHTTGRT